MLTTKHHITTEQVKNILKLKNIYDKENHLHKQRIMLTPPLGSIGENLPGPYGHITIEG